LKVWKLVEYERFRYLLLPLKKLFAIYSLLQYEPLDPLSIYPVNDDIKLFLTCVVIAATSSLKAFNSSS